MGITIAIQPRTRSLTTRARVKSVGKITDTKSDDRIDDAIVAMSDAIAAHCGREFARASVVERLGSDGGIYLQLSRYPVVSLGVITYRGDTISNVTIDDSESGLIYREGGFVDSHTQRWTLDRFEVPNGLRSDWLVPYVSGYLLPSDDLVGVRSDISAAASDSSLNSVGAKFPALLQAGDVITVSGFATAANNGTFAVVSATTSKIIVAGSLVTEASSATTAVSIRCSTLPDSVERACILATLDQTLNAHRNESVRDKSVGDTRLSYVDRGVVSADAAVVLPPRALALLRPYCAIVVA